MEELECPLAFNELERKAWQFAVTAHGEQRRKYHQEPYVKHLERVAQTVMAYGGTTGMVMAALLHDVLEDTPVTQEELKAFLEETCQGSIVKPAEVLQMVLDLTDQFTKQQAPGYNRKRRKELERQRTATTSGRAQTIKLADIIDNTRDIIAHDFSFARVYIPEIVGLLEVLKSAQPFTLYLLACYEVQKALFRLEEERNSLPPEETPALEG
ncbi:HD domain-containing protein [Rufibacter quisquiliarum]|uniref:(P)ppGpp synthase/HD superfamily hydrolase n=1 Tax=Rufibacter quisquiliarum TaxID=1549639 RepID=A0A839GDF3_9BACT|nr:HD domain-containing protein [Rufibacter quisquiliarum]MBA9076942.1 (p)ppGpp synthase/HD superfamily hydrolase [Rufibacter quisquiliarum]